jgi:DNA-binding PucR family transcriptional regulator
MLIPVGNWLIWGWAHHESPAVEQLSLTLAVPAGVRVAIGSTAVGIEGLVRTHREAVEARRVARLLGDRAGGRVVFHHDVVVLALLTANPIAARQFVEAELGALVAPDEQMARLRMTLRVYFEENLSPVRTARRLGVNKNTIVYRVEKVQEILRHDVHERRRELEAAVQLAEIYDALRRSV